MATPEANINQTSIVENVVGVGAVVGTGYVAYQVVKWIVAGVLAPSTSGSSLVVAGLTPYEEICEELSFKLNPNMVIY